MCDAKDETKMMREKTAEMDTSQECQQSAGCENSGIEVPCNKCSDEAIMIFTILFILYMRVTRAYVTVAIPMARTPPLIHIPHTMSKVITTKRFLSICKTMPQKFAMKPGTVIAGLDYLKNQQNSSLSSFTTKERS